MVSFGILAFWHLEVKQNQKELPFFVTFIFLFFEMKKYIHTYIFSNTKISIYNKSVLCRNAELEREKEEGEKSLVMQVTKLELENSYLKEEKSTLLTRVQFQSKQLQYLKSNFVPKKCLLPCNIFHTSHPIVSSDEKYISNANEVLNLKECLSMYN